MYIQVLETEENIFPFTDFNETHFEITEIELAELGIYKVQLVETPKRADKLYGYGDPYFEDETWKVSEVEVGNIEVDVNKLANTVRKERDARIQKEMWKYERYERETRLGLPLSDNLTALDTYIQNLADLPNQEEFPLLVTWPTLSE